MSGTHLLGLPAEILTSILCCSADIASFQNFILTCHQIHSIYARNKTEVVRALLYHLIFVQAGCATDAEYCAIVEPWQDDRTDDNGLAFREMIKAYRTKHAEQLATNQNFQNPKKTLFPVGPWPEDFTITSIVHQELTGPWPARDCDLLPRLYIRHKHIETCAEMFIRGTTTSSQHNVKMKRELTDGRPKEHLSRTERRRLYRAFYRLEMYHLLFDVKWGLRTQEYEFRQWQWLTVFPPHELDEIGTVYQWLSDEWVDIVSNMQEITRKQWGTWLFWTQQWMLKRNFITRGLRFFLDVLASDHAIRLQLVKDICAETTVNYDIGLLLSNATSVRVHHNTTSSDDGLPDTGSELIFQDDHPDTPNLAWIWSKHGRMSTLFFDRQDTDLRRIGYVMWDHDRLAEWPIYREPRTRSRLHAESRER